jgi:hydrogenase maturation protein HypF
LTAPAAPILLLRKGGLFAAIADAVAPKNPYLGVMLPYTPLHDLLLARLGRPVVCTSGNLSEEPMAIRTEEAVARLGAIADYVLTHNRPIVRPVDDSVGRIGPAGLQLLRRARGYPLAVSIGDAAGTADTAVAQGERRVGPVSVILAVGGHLKNTVALGLGSDVVLSPHIGDLDNALSVEMHCRAVQDLVAFFGVTPAVVACDLHPDYASTRHAEQLAANWDVPLVRVQHHHAHVAGGMAEHRLHGPVLGFSWDGTGYGTDGTAWGGEVLLCAGADFTRVAHLRVFPLPGGDRAAREPRRAALGLLFEMLGDAAAVAAGPWFTSAELAPLLAALQRLKLFPRTSSMGRLFDAVAVLCGLPDRVSFEGQAAMGLEFAADPAVSASYPLPVSDGTPAVADWEPLIRAVLDDRRRGVGVPEIAAKFHNALADLTVAVARRANCRQVVLTGGCFQNALLTVRARERLSAAGFRVYIHQEVPAGDGGIALGQVWLAAQTRK